MFTDVIDYRVVHNTNIAYNGEVVTGFLEIDEMWPLWLLSNNETKKKNFVLFPNPTTGILNVESATTIAQIEIYNSLGQLVYLNANPQPERVAGNTIDITGVSPGLYFLKIWDKKGNVGFKKIVKE